MESNKCNKDFFRGLFVEPKTRRMWKTSESIFFLKQLDWLVLGAKLMEINSNLFKPHGPWWF